MIPQPRSSHWLLAVGLAAAVHTLALVRPDAEPDPTERAQDPGAQSVTIALAPPPKAAEPEPEPEPKPEPDTQPSPKPRPESEPLDSEVKTEKTEDEEPEPEEPDEEKPEEPEKPDTDEAPETEPEKDPDASDAEAEASTEETTDNDSDRDARESADQRQAGATGGIQDASPDYRAEVSAWLERHKEYPMRSRRQAEQGMAMVSFTFNRKGQILDYELTRATGHERLDRAVKEMLERADPLPRMPEDMDEERMTWTLPVYFRLN